MNCGPTNAKIFPSMLWRKRSSLGSSGRSLIGISIVLSAFFGSLHISPADAAASLSREGCHVEKLVSYGEPFTRMAPIRHIPDSGKLPFAPPRIRLGLITEPILVGPATLGFELALAQSGPPVKLGWTVVSTFTLVNRSGKPVKVLRTKREHVGSLGKESEEFEIPLRVSRRPAMFRVDIAFSDRRGRWLGRYAEYFRILRKRGDVRQVLPDRHLNPGDLLISRLQNWGTTRIFFGNEYAVDRFLDGAWQLDPMTPKGFAGVGISIGAGSAYVCPRFRLPLDVEPGHYRFRQVADVVGGKRHRLSSDFYVIP